ncbi:MAG: YceI family protein [Taibaiella sp.]|nr:YceI family protein [Taibaiella sp.]
MKRLQLAIIASATALLTAFTTVNLWNSDPAHTDLGFSIGHLGISDVAGSFNEFTATINSSKTDFSDAVIEASINAASVDTRVEARDQHLRSADFFDVEKYPTITFKSTSLKNSGKNKYKVTGDLTAKGITKEVVLELTYRGSLEHPQSKKMTAGFKLKGEIKRSDFGIGTNFPAPMLSDEVAITINGEFQQ